MDEITLVVLFLGLLIFSSHLFSKLFNKTKIPNVLILMIIGIIAGFFIDKQLFFGEMGKVFTTITLIIILFESGVGLKLNELKTAITSATLVTVLNFIITVAIVFLVSHYIYKLDYISSLFLGSILGGTSSAVVIPMIKQLNLGSKSSTILLLESAFTDVLCLVVSLAIFEGMKAGEINAMGILNSMWQSFLFAALLGIIAGIIWSLLLNGIRVLQNSMFTTFAFLFIVYAIVEAMGLNGGIAALSLGIILGNSSNLNNSKLWKSIFKFEAATLTDNEKSFFAEIVFILQTYFFVYVGIVLEFGNISTYFIALLIIALVLLLRPLTILFFARKGSRPHEVTMMSIMAPKGLISAIMASVPLQYVLSQGEEFTKMPYAKEIAEMGYAVVLVSIVVCSILVIIASRDPFIFNKMLRKKKRELNKTKTNETEHVNFSPETEDKSENDDFVIKVNKKYIDEFDD
ncbi:MAG: hypothetical protein GX793_04275 [Bacteroidales bacterium]|nr:cation:proton antiporter [Bacteroidales bacterium]NLB86261.1 hypothetical protein [Bacteroidales bacterium]